MSTRTPQMPAGANAASRLLPVFWVLMALLGIATVVAFLLDAPWTPLLGLGLVFLGLSLLRDSRHYRATPDPVLRWTFVTLGLVILLSGLATTLYEISR